MSASTRSGRQRRFRLLKKPAVRRSASSRHQGGEAAVVTVGVIDDALTEAAAYRLGRLVAEAELRRQDEV
jgi:hypothetical protein